MWKWIVCVVALASSGMAAEAATGMELPIEGATLVWIQPLDASPGSMGASLSLTLPKRIVGEKIASIVKGEVVTRPVGGQVRVDPGLSVSLTTDVGIPVKCGVVALPMTRYKIGWFVGATIFSTPL